MSFLRLLYLQAIRLNKTLSWDFQMMR